MERVQAARDYVELLGTGHTERLTRIERWLGRESYLFRDEQWWPKTLPEFFYQQLYNRSVEEEHPLKVNAAPRQWLRQMIEVGAECRSLLRIFAGHRDSLNSVAFSPNGKLVVTGSNDGRAWLWETESGRHVSTLKVQSGPLMCIAFSPDGTMVLTGSLDRTVRLWEIGSGKKMYVLNGHIDSVNNVTFSPDGNLAITCDQHGQVIFWRVSDLDEERLSGRYVATYEVGAVYWQNATHLVLADLGGPHFRPHFYYLKLEGTW